MTLHRSKPSRQSAKARRRSRQRRFASPSVPVFSPRRLFSSSGKTKRKRSRSRFHPLKRLRQRAWDLSHLAAAFLLVAALSAAVYGFASIDFWVYSARVESNRYTPAPDVYRQAGIHGYSIFFIDPNQVRARLKEMDHVRDAQVTVALPATVRIKLWEREPVIAYHARGQQFWIDEEGMIAPAAEERDGLIELIDDGAAASIDPKHINLEVLRAIQYITHRIPQVTTFRYQEPYGLYFISPEKWRVYLGSAESMDEKLSEWETIRSNILRDGVAAQEVDLRYERPFWR